MKTIFCLFALGLSFTTSAAPIIDFSEDNSSAYSDKLYEFEKQSILSQLYGTQYATDWDQCKGEETLIESDLQIAKGSFSAPGLNEMIVTFTTNTCPGSHAGRHSTLALVRDGKVIAATNELFSAQIEKVLDVDGDGASEAITSLSDGNGGYFNTLVTSVRFAGGRIQEFDYVSGVVNTTSCAAFTDESEGRRARSRLFPLQNRRKTNPEELPQILCGRFGL